MSARDVFNSRLARLLNVNAITLYPFVFYSSASPSAAIIAHEHVHIQQIKSIGIFRFYISYLLYYLAGRLRGLGDTMAYLQIPYEVDAYKKQHEVERDEQFKT